MNIETVNELIASLESAGELSIREQKFLNLAKAHVQLAAENVALKQSERELDKTCTEEFGQDWVSEFTETPATDRIVAGIKADEEKAVLNDLLRHLDKIDIENLSSPWELSSEVVAFVNSRLLREGADK